MGLDLAQRLYSLVHGLGQTSEAHETKRLSQELQNQLTQHRLLTADARTRLGERLAEDVLSRFSLPPSHRQLLPIANLINDVLDQEQLFALPMLTIGSMSTAEHWDLQKLLRDKIAIMNEFDAVYEQVCIFICLAIDPVFTAYPALVEEQTGQGITVNSKLISLLPNVGRTVERMAQACSSEELREAGLIENVRTKLEYNLIRASGGNPSDPASYTKTHKFPSKSDIVDPLELVTAYLGGTGLAGFLHQNVSFTIPTKTRFEHHHIIAGSGHGKTQTLQHLIAKDIEQAASSGRSIVVLDSQGDLINNISKLAVFRSGGALEDKIVIIDPTDVEYPVSLNLFDVGQERLNSYAPLERERLTNSILELYDFVLGSLLSAEMTQKQNVIFRYVTRLMLHIPNATIHTLRELMEPGSQEKFAEHIAKLSGTARHFFDTEFSSREFEQTKKQVLRRLWGILENQTFERMFSHPTSKLDLYSEMSAGKVILINTAKDLLKESGTEIFGRFFIALIAQAAQERSIIAQSKRMPTLVYIDEAADYFDRNIGIILSQARKYNVGMVLAHQYMGQLNPALQDAVAANTSIKFVGGVSTKDARAMAQQLHCDPSFIEQQGKGSFAAYVRGSTKSAVPLSFPFGYMEKLPQMSNQERQALQERMRARHAVHYNELHSAQDNENNGPESETPSETVAPTKPTKGW